MSAAVRLPGKPIVLDDVIEEASNDRALDSNLEREAQRLFILYHMKGNSIQFTFLLFKSTINIPEAVEFAKRYCVSTLNARFVRIEPAIHIID